MHNISFKKSNNDSVADIERDAEFNIENKSNRTNSLVEKEIVAEFRTDDSIDKNIDDFNNQK